MVSLRIIALVFVGLVISLGLFTWWALESGGVAIVETRAPDGSTRSTHVWFVEPDGELWLEAGTPSNPWYLDAQLEPLVSLTADDLYGEFLVETLEHPGARDRIRSLLRSKYGVRDWWVAVLFDTSSAIAVRLVPVTP